MTPRLSRRQFCSAVVLSAAGFAAAGCSSDADPVRPPASSETPPDAALAFPEDFRWGVATSAYQIEGAVRADGRGRSIWDTFCDRTGTIADGSSGAIACDHYNRWESDLDLMRTLGIGSYRFSIAWPRVLPKGTGSVNRRGLGFYDRLVDGLLARGIAPVATLYHWDLPQDLQDRGGWQNRDSAEWFSDYAAVVFAALGDRVDSWLTINETKVIAQQGYIHGRMAPGITDAETAGAVIHHLNLAHGRAVSAFRASKAHGRIGPCLQLAPCYPADESEEAAAAAKAADVTENTLYLDPLLKRRYPSLSRTDHELAAGLETAVREGDLPVIAAPVDFLGVNYYSPMVVDGQGQPLQPHPVSAAGWQQIYPQGLYDTLTRIRRDYASPEVVIMENGVPDDSMDSSQPTVDNSRIDFLDQHLRALHRAIADGCRVTGYHAWSLMDNFEWAAGYSQRWGLVRVDFDTLSRTPKNSASWYATVAGSNELPAR
jgi:beta-glucosidase